MSFKDILILLPCQSLEDLSLNQRPDDAAELLTASTATFHPAIISLAGQVPRWVAAENAPDADELEGSLVFLPKSSVPLLSENWLQQSANAGATLIRNLSDRRQTVDEVLATPKCQESPLPDVDAGVVDDFFALGYCRLIVELLTRQIHYTSSLDEEQFQEHVVKAAQAASKGDHETTRGQLQQAFDQLTHAREYYFPMGATFIDLTLVASNTLGVGLARELQQPEKTNLLITGNDLEKMARCEPETFSVLQQSLASDTATLIGGEQTAAPISLMPAEAILANLRRGMSTHERLLDLVPKVFARRRFGLSSMIPQIIAKLGFEAALHISLDAGRFPNSDQSHIIWEGLGGSSIDALAPTVLDAANPQSFLRLPDRLSSGIDLDNDAVLAFAHWPDHVCCWYEDLRRMAQYSPVLGSFGDLNSYFEDNYGSGHAERFSADEYRSAYLQQAVAAGEPDAISRWVNYYRRRTAADAICGVSLLSSMISPQHESQREEKSPCEERSQFEGQSKREQQATLFAAIDEALISNDHWHKNQNDNQGDKQIENLDNWINDLTDAAARDLARRLPRADAAQRSGYLVINPWSFSRSVAGQPLENSSNRSTETVPAMGYLWLDSRTGVDANPIQSPPCQESAKLKNDSFIDSCIVNEPSRTVRKSSKSAWKRRICGCTRVISYIGINKRFFGRKSKKIAEPPLAEENILRNEFFEITFDPASGAIRAVHDYRSRNNRLAQQVALRQSGMNLAEASDDEEAKYTIMAADEFVVSRCDKNVGEMCCRGRLVDRQAKTVSRFTQTTRVRRGSRIIELQIDVEPDILPTGNPWDCYYAARFAWHDSMADVFRDVNSTTQPTANTLLESPRFVDIRSEKSRLTILTGGLPFHRQFGLRKLDTLLIVNGERSRSFRLGIGIDLPRPDAAAIEFLAPLPFVEATTAPPACPCGWLFHIDTRNVICTAWETIEENARAVGFAARLLETEGRNTRFHMRCFRELGVAESSNFRGGECDELVVDGDRITIDLAAHEWMQIEARWKQK